MLSAALGQLYKEKVILGQTKYTPTTKISTGVTCT
jgi:hypothetical protein